LIKRIVAIAWRIVFATYKSIAGEYAGVSRTPSANNVEFQRDVIDGPVRKQVMASMISMSLVAADYREACAQTGTKSKFASQAVSTTEIARRNRLPTQCDRISSRVFISRCPPPASRLKTVTTTRLALKQVILNSHG
jgi:hypothetical protein